MSYYLYATKPGQDYPRKLRVGSRKVFKDKKDEMDDHIGGLKEKKELNTKPTKECPLQPTKLHLILSLH